MEAVCQPNVGVVLDAANCLPNEERAMEVTEALTTYTINFHVKDLPF